MKCKGSYKRSAAEVRGWPMPSQRTLFHPWPHLVLPTSDITLFMTFTLFLLLSFIFIFFFGAVLEGTKKQPQCIPMSVQTLKFAFCIAFGYFLKVITIVFAFYHFFPDSHSTQAFVLPLSNVGRSGYLWTVMLSKYFSPSQARFNVSR